MQRTMGLTSDRVCRSVVSADSDIEFRYIQVEKHREKYLIIRSVNKGIFEHEGDDKLLPLTSRLKLYIIF